MNRVAFIGSNPSIKSLLSVPFWHNAKCTSTLMKWIPENISDTFFTNVLNTPTEGNKPLSMAQIKIGIVRLKKELDQMQPTKIVALGKTAAKALTLLGVEFYAMPHPSGLNRQLNDKEYMAEKINGLKEYLESI